MKPSAYVTNIVEPTIEEFEAEPTSVRRAYLACLVTWHFADCVKEAGSLKLSEIRQKLEESCPTFRLIGAIATLSKHFRLDDPRWEGVRINHTDIHVGPTSAFSDGTYFSDSASWADSPDVVRADKGGQPVDLLFCLHRAGDGIRQFLNSDPSF